MRKNCSLIGAATDLGQSKPGTDLGPSWLKLNGITEVISQKYFRVDDLGDLTPTRSASVAGHDHELINNYNKRLCDTIEQQLKRDQSIITLGGDHSIAIGTLSASLKHNPNTKVVWVDAHADVNTPETSPSQNVHGMPLALFFKLDGLGPMKDLFSWVPELKPENLAYIGLRDVDQGEIEFLNKLGIRNYTADDVAKRSIEVVLSEILEQFNNDDETAPIHLSFDVDGLDPKFVPATGTPVDSGLHLMDGQMIVNTLAKTKRLISFDLVEVNPQLGTSKRDLELTLESVKALMEALPEWNDMDLGLDEILRRKTIDSFTGDVELSEHLPQDSH